MQVSIVKGDATHAEALTQLYQEVAKAPDGIIREPEEISVEQVRETVLAASRNGLTLMAMIDGDLVGEIHAITPPLQAFRHLLTDLTIVVSPAHQGKGIGKKLFTQFLDHVESNMKHILRVELYTREHNSRNTRFYKGLGFVNEGHQTRKILTPGGQFHTPIHMAWFNPAFDR